MIYEIGDLAVVSVAFTDTNNNPADPTAVTLIVQAPDNTQATYTDLTTPAVVRNSTGNYSLNLPISESGTYLYRWTGTGALQAVVEGTLTVQATILVPQPVPYVSPGWSQADIDALDAAIKTGVTSVRFQDREVTYRSMNDLLKARAFASTQVAAATGQIPTRQLRVYSDKGWAP